MKLLFTAFAGLVALVFQVAQAEPPSQSAVVQGIVKHAQASPGGDAPASYDVSSYAGQDLSSLPIGVFDSGIGGLTVLQAILGLDQFHNDTLKPGPDGVPDFQNERFIYFGDQANMPYGNYSSAGKTDYLRELILKDTLFLLGRRYHADGAARMDKPPVKAVVIACNTATAYGLQDIRAALKAWGLPVIVVGVVEAGARGVKEARSGQGDNPPAVGVLATVGTCASEAYPRLIGSTLGLAGLGAPMVTQHGSAGLAGVIEGDPAFTRSLADQALDDVTQLVARHRQEGVRLPLGTVVLGCTHYPLARAEIDAAFTRLRADAANRGLIADHITYVDPAEWTARELFRELASARLRTRPGQSRVLEKHAFFFSVANPACAEARLSADGTLEKDYKYGRNPGRPALEDTLNIRLTPDRLPPVGRNLVQGKLPLVWAAMQAQ